MNKIIECLNLIFPNGIKPDQFEDALAIIKLIEKQNIDNKDELSTKATNDLLDKLKFDLMPTKFTFPEKTSPKVIETEITWTKSRGIIGDPFVGSLSKGSQYIKNLG
jgi:hypothetical protein